MSIFFINQIILKKYRIHENARVNDSHTVHYKGEGVDAMKVTVDIDMRYEQTEIDIRSERMTEQLEHIMQIAKSPPYIIGFKNERQYLIRLIDIVYVATENNYLVIETKIESYQSKQKLYQLEQILQQYQFVKLSQSAIANPVWIDYVHVTFNGVLAIHFKNGSVQYSSRRYVKKIKEQLLRRNEGSI